MKHTYGYNAKTLVYSRTHIGGGNYIIEGVIPNLEVGDTIYFEGMQRKVEVTEIIENRDAKGVWKNPKDAEQTYFKFIGNDKTYKAGQNYSSLNQIGINRQK